MIIALILAIIIFILFIIGYSKRRAVIIGCGGLTFYYVNDFANDPVLQAFELNSTISFEGMF